VSRSTKKAGMVMGDGVVYCAIIIKPNSQEPASISAVDRLAVCAGPRSRLVVNSNKKRMLLIIIIFVV